MASEAPERVWLWASDAADIAAEPTTAHEVFVRTYDPNLDRGADPSPVVSFIRADLASPLPLPGSEGEAEMASLALSHMMRALGEALAMKDALRAAFAPGARKEGSDDGE